MNSNAPGQMLGYVLQLQRALVHLLQRGPGDSVCVEVIGDVSVHTKDTVVSEEDKSSISSNPVTDKSTDLWKTFSNWITSIKKGDLDIEKTIFILYSNHVGRAGIVNVFSITDTNKKALDAIKHAIKILDEIDKSHKIYPYLSSVLSNKDLFARIIVNFEFVVGSKSSDTEIHNELIKQHVPDGQVAFMHDELLGWVTNFVLDKIKVKSHPVITWDEFNHRFLHAFGRARKKELIDFTFNKEPSKSDVSSRLKEYPYYIKQLQIIGLEEHDQIRAVSDFLRSKVNMDAWIENDIIDELAASSFEENLTRYWENTKKRISVTHRDLNSKDRGVILHSECMNKNERIANQDPPPSTVSGCYHALADDDNLGWHESWKEVLGAGKGIKS